MLHSMTRLGLNSPLFTLDFIPHSFSKGTPTQVYATIVWKALKTVAQLPLPLLIYRLCTLMYTRICYTCVIIHVALQPATHLTSCVDVRSSSIPRARQLSGRTLLVDGLTVPIGLRPESPLFLKKTGRTRGKSWEKIDAGSQK